MNPDITGIKADNTQYKLSVYADDLLFSLTNPTVSLPSLMKAFEIYDTLSNLKINFDKSAAMGVQIAPTLLASLKANFKFKWSDTALKYTYIPGNLACTYDLNFPPLLSETRLLVDKWHKGIHSWFGRCNLLKMCILPKYLYLFQALPIHIPTYYFKQVHSLFTKFVWVYKKNLDSPDAILHFLNTWEASSSQMFGNTFRQRDVPLKGALWHLD